MNTTRKLKMFSKLTIIKLNFWRFLAILFKDLREFTKPSGGSLKICLKNQNSLHYQQWFGPKIQMVICPFSRDLTSGVSNHSQRSQLKIRLSENSSEQLQLFSHNPHVKVKHVTHRKLLQSLFSLVTYSLGTILITGYLDLKSQ